MPLAARLFLNNAILHAVVTAIFVSVIVNDLLHARFVFRDYLAIALGALFARFAYVSFRRFRQMQAQ